MNLSGLLESPGTLPEPQSAAYTFDGHIPKTVVLPASVQEMQEVLRFASKRDLSVIPAGAGTKLGIGNLPQKLDIVLATTRLNGVVEYEPADLTVTVEAGIRLATLASRVGTTSTVPRVGSPVCRPMHPRWNCRNKCEWFAPASTRSCPKPSLGLRVVHANGTVVKSGGKVVKNVAGYDLNKLYIGAFGTLGIITEVTLKLSPIPAYEAILVADFQNVQGALDTGLSIIGSQILPMFVNLSINANCVGTANG